MNIFEQFGEKYIDTSTVKIKKNNSEVTISVSVNSSLYTVEATLPVNIIDKTKAENILTKLNKSHSVGFYFLDKEESKLILKTVIWSANKPSKALLEELINTLVANAICMSNLLEDL